MTVDPKAKAEVTEELAKLIMTLALVEKAEAQATWLSAPDLDMGLHAAYMAKDEAYEAAYLDYIAARRDLIRWGVVS
jgi:hypothetical protein